MMNREFWKFKYSKIEIFLSFGNLLSSSHYAQKNK
jgi:hypothetical protein